MCKVLSSIPSTVRQKQKEARLQNLVALTISKLIAFKVWNTWCASAIWGLIFQLLPHSPKFVFYVKHYRMCILLITISWVIFRTVYSYLARHIYLCDNLYLYGWIGGEFFAEMHKDWILLPTAGSSKQNRTLAFCIFFQFPADCSFLLVLWFQQRVLT